MNNRPLIGITRNSNSKGYLLFLIAAFSVWLAGGRSISITYLQPHFYKNIKGMIFHGGEDIYPKFFNGKLKADYSYTIHRDEMEFAWLQRCESQNIPVLGICRGLHLINVAKGGTLLFDARIQFGSKSYSTGWISKIFLRKEIHIFKNTLLYNILKTEKYKVNSNNTQVIDKLGHNLIVSSRENNNMIQSIEDPSKRFYLGLQFHPEYFLFSNKMRNIFKIFILSAKNTY